jgi:uncharacterized membrane protein
MALFLLILLSLLFVATHLGMSHDPCRSHLVRRLGPLPFMGAYSLVSLVTLGGAIWVFATHEHRGPQLWTLPCWLYPVVYLLMLLSFLLLVLSVSTPSPTGMRPAPMEPRGVLRVTRHPMNMGFACFGLAHVLANGTLGDVFFFGSIFLVGFAGAYHQDRRKAREHGEPFRNFQRRTSVFPFAAILRGKTGFAPGEMSRPLLVTAVAAFLAALLLHEKLFGVRPF